MSYKVQLIYFRPTGKFLTTAETQIMHEPIAKIWDEVHELRRIGRLPGLRPNAGRDLLIVVDVPDHPDRVLHLVMPPFVDEDDITPPHVSTGDMPPLSYAALAELSRTTTRDVVKVDLDAEPEADTVVSDVEGGKP